MAGTLTLWESEPEDDEEKDESLKSENSTRVVSLGPENVALLIEWGQRKRRERLIPRRKLFS
ncbi:hypothetical protein [Acrocarpospora catenulata]|uniref:hypothetical protein n=1 Tax=Acrocarpospora catenulata TaxID=2836182 RepID=UPI001BD96A9C|nr:hypothetical protein [Acrocarpospora catenulata]